jgi:putative spermidine/putrescine transport system substrate-binding protein
MGEQPLVQSSARPRPRIGQPPRLHRRGLIALAAGGVLTAAGCVGQSPPPSPPASPIPATPVGPIPGFEDPQRWAGRTLRVGAWGDEVQAALRRALWEPFVTATGCTIAEVTTDYGRLQEAIGQGRGYADVLLVDPIWAVTALGQGLVQPLDATGLDLAPLADFPGGEGSAPAYAYAQVSAYRRDAITAESPPQSWAEWWDRARFAGPRALARDPFGTFEFALLSTGVAPNQLYPLDAAKAIARLQAISDKIVERWWDSGLQPVAWLGTERIDLASAWHYRVIAGQQDGYAIDLVWHQGLLVTDRWVVPAGATAPDVALDFIRYALTPRAQAALAREVPLGPVVPAAFTLLEPMVAARLPTAPANLPNLIRADVGWWAAHRGDAVQAMNSWLLGA